MAQPMSSSVIPPTPSAADYADSGDRALIPETADPIALLQQWMADARASELNDSNAMSLATVDADGNPDVRVVLLKGVDASGFTFFTNLESAKGQQLAAHPNAALGFHWKSLRRQVRIRGSVARVSDAEADAYAAALAAGIFSPTWNWDEIAAAVIAGKINMDEEKRAEDRGGGGWVPQRAAGGWFAR
jgi:pyridoxamine 5'-phosphate oxidase